jgi:hypothetical protein
MNQINSIQRQKISNELKRYFGPSPMSMSLHQRIDARGLLSCHERVMCTILGVEYNKTTRSSNGNMKQMIRNLKKQGIYLDRKVG